MFGIPIKYSDFFSHPVPKKPVDLILSIPKDELIATVNAINTRLRPIYQANFDNSVETQIECLRAILLDLGNPFDNGIATPFKDKFLEYSSNSLLFTRVTCLFAFQEIIATKGFAKTRPPEYSQKQRIDIFKYLLICNERILFFNNAYSGKDHKILGNRFFEYFMFKELLQKTDIVYHLRRIKVNHPQRVKVSIAQRMKVNH